MNQYNPKTCVECQQNIIYNRFHCRTCDRIYCSKRCMLKNMILKGHILFCDFVYSESKN